MNNIQLAVADDHPLVLDGIKSLVEDAEGIDLVLTALNGQELLQKMNRLQVNVVLLDIDMPVKNGIDTAREIKEKFSGTKVIILTMHDEPAMIRQLVTEGADGYLLKNCGRDELLLAIRNVFIGKRHFSGEVTIQLMKADSEPLIAEELKELTPREIEILRLIAAGKSNKEIGDQLFISHRTVDTHRTNIMKKLDVHNIAGLVRVAFRNKLTD
jgi:two-component system response regulator NreC